MFFDLPLDKSHFITEIENENLHDLKSKVLLIKKEILKMPLKRKLSVAFSLSGAGMITGTVQKNELQFLCRKWMQS